MKQTIRKILYSVTLTASLVSVCPFQTVKAEGEQTTEQMDMYRMYNPNSGEHFYTGNVNERDHLLRAGWNYEGVGWTSPVTSSQPVFRVYNPVAGDHHYTMDAHERDVLVSLGWRDEGIGWYSDEAEAVPVYRQYNPNAVAGAHNFTVSANENNYLRDHGWKEEGISWYAQNDLDPSPSHPVAIYHGKDYSPVYDFHDYQAMNPDIQQKYGNDDAGTLKDFVTHGIYARRGAKNGVDPNQTFEAYYGLNNAAKRVRPLLNNANGNGIVSLDGYPVDQNIIASVQNGIRQVGTDCGFVMIDLRTGRGLGYNMDEQFYSASSIKGPYAAAVTKYNGADSAHMDLIQNILWFSDNRAYASLFHMYRDSAMQRWYDESNVGGYSRNLYDNYSARDLSRLWVTMFDYFQNDSHGASFSNLYTRPNVSPIHTDLGNRYVTKTKAGWINDGPGLTVINDSGIVYAGDHPYVMTVMSKVGDYHYERLDGLIYALDDAHNRMTAS